MADASFASHPNPEAEEMIGQTISHYRITEKLGGGGMGVVYKATDTKLDRPVALKFLPPELTRDPDSKRRFVHEAKAASALQHHNICTIHEIDEADDGRMFICMDCYEGETLKQRIAHGPLPLDDAIDIVSQVAEGLAKAHAEGMVHRDIKPANIMITADGVVKIVDFGLAKLAGQTKVTKTGTTVGTVAYMSPEQATGKEIDQRSDIFSLGSVFYEMLTGKLPFEGDHEAAVLYGIMNTEPDRVTNHRKDIPERLGEIVGRSMAKEPDDRYMGAMELLEELAPMRRQRAVGAGASHVGHKKIGTKNAVGFLILVVLIAVVAFVVGKQRAGAPSVDELSLAIVDFSDVADAGDPVLSAGITNLVHVGLVESSPIRVVSPTYLQDIRRRLFGEKRGPIAESEAMEVAKESGATFLLTGTIATLGGDQYVTWTLMNVENGNSLAARRVEEKHPVELANRIVADVLPALGKETGITNPGVPASVSTMTTDSPEAYRHYIAGVLASDEARTEEAVQHFERAVRVDSTFALAYFELSRAHTRESGAARDYADKAWALRARLGEKDRKRLEAWRAWVDYNLQAALAIERDLLSRWPDDGAILRGLAEKLYANWYAGESLPIAEEGLRLYPEDYWFAVVRLLGLQVMGGKEKALDAARLLVARYPQTPDAWDSLGLTYLQAGLPDSATASFNKALAIAADFLWSQRNLGHLSYYRGDANRAIQTLKGVLERTDLLPRQRLTILCDYMIQPGVAFFYAEQGRFRESFEVIERAKQHALDFEGEVRFVISARNRLLLGIGRADEVLASAASLAERGEPRIARLKALEFRTQALVALDSLEAARSGVEEILKAEAFWGGYSRIVALGVTVEIALREGNSGVALTVLEELKSHGMHFGGTFHIESEEQLARAYRLAGRLEDAIRVHEELLRLYGGHALSHYALGQLYEEMRRPKDAVGEYEAFLDMWSQADEGLPQVEDARTRLAALRQATQ